MRPATIQRSTVVHFVTWLLVSGVQGLAPASAFAAHDLVRASPNFDDLMNQAEDKRAQEDYAESARLYAEAYRSRPEEDRVDLMGEITIGNAIADYQLARERDPHDLGLSSAQAELMSEFIDAREQAHEAGNAEAVPSGMVEELGELREQIETLGSTLDEATTNEAKTDEEPPPAETGSEPAQRTKTSGDSPRTTNPKVDATILGIGVASVLGGAGFIIGGAWNLNRLGLRDDRLAALNANTGLDDQQRQEYLAQIDAWDQQWRGKTKGMIAGGAVLTATGIGLTTWAAIRLRVKDRLK